MVTEKIKPIPSTRRYFEVGSFNVMDVWTSKRRRVLTRIAGGYTFTINQLFSVLLNLFRRKRNNCYIFRKIHLCPSLTSFFTL